MRVIVGGGVLYQRYDMKEGCEWIKYLMAMLP